MKEHDNIGEASARRMAVERYHQLFRDKYYLNPVEGKYHEFPEFGESFFDKVKIKDAYWQLEGEPPAGIYVSARVDLQGKWV